MAGNPCTVCKQPLYGFPFTCRYCGGAFHVTEVALCGKATDVPLRVAEGLTVKLSGPVCEICMYVEGTSLVAAARERLDTEGEPAPGN